MVRVYFDKTFVKQAAKLPSSQQKLLARKLTYFREDPFDPRMHTKQLSTPLEGIFLFGFHENTGYSFGSNRRPWSSFFL